MPWFLQTAQNKIQLCFSSDKDQSEKGYQEEGTGMQK